MILICESCEHGYSDTLTACPWCGASSALAHSVAPDPVSADTECYIDYWLCNVGGESFEKFDDHPLDITGLRRALSRATIITFNGISYDLPMIAAALAGATRKTLFNWESGAASPNAAALAAWADAGLDVLYVVTGQRAGGASAPPPPRAVSEGDRILLDNFHAAPAQVQAGVKTTLGAFAPKSDARRGKAA